MTAQNPFKVRFDTSEEDGAHSRAIASLPAHFKPTEGTAAVVLADNARPVQGVQATMVCRPSLMPREAHRDTITVPALRFAPRLAIDPITGRDGGDFQIATINLALAHWRADAVAEAVAELLACLRALRLRAADLFVVSVADTHIMLSGHAENGAPFKLSAARSALGIDECVLSAAAVDHRLEACMHSGPAIRSAKIVRHDMQGSALSFPVHQSGFRLMWLDLHARLTGSGRAFGDLLTGADLKLLDAALS